MKSKKGKGRKGKERKGTEKQGKEMKENERNVGSERQGEEISNGNKANMVSQTANKGRMEDEATERSRSQYGRKPG